MTDQLPISIFVCDDLSTQWVKITSITNKLAAQLNFQSMTANWYGNEDDILCIQLLLETPQRFALQKEQLQIEQVSSFNAYSDDVFSFIDDTNPPQLICTIALTVLEQNLLAQQEKLLAGLLQVKLTKVLNLIAKQFNFSAI